MTLTIQECSQALLARGFFPKELPPPFQTHAFADKASSIKEKWDTFQNRMSSKARATHPEPSHPILFDMARKGHARRTLAIPNAVNQFYVVEEIAKRWEAISLLIESSALSITKCTIAPSGRAIPVLPLSALAEKRISLYATQGAILQTDVLSFYHSIYTHAIPWALHGKAEAKANRNPNDTSVFGNRIDFLIRSCQDGQTIGIPVGPDTSRIISEFMLCAVEAKIPLHLRKRIACGFRYIDDFFLCFGNSADAEAVLAGLREACLHFDLQLNASKTHTIPALAFNEEAWPSEISAIPIASSGKNQRRSLIRFFSTVIRLAKDLPNESIASFAIRKTARLRVSRENWDVYEAFLLRVARENSNCIDSVVKILCTYAAIGYVMSSSVQLFIERTIADHAPYNQHFEVAWVLWLARSLEIRISSTASSHVFKMENDICIILALHLRGRSLMSGGAQISSWLGSISNLDLRSNHWLLIYEAASRKGWPISHAAAAAVANDDFFWSLKEENISFYNTKAYNRPVSIPNIEDEINRALNGRKRALLPGAIMAVDTSLRDEDDFEVLGGDYEGSVDDIWLHFRDGEEDVF